MGRWREYGLDSGERPEDWRDKALCGSPKGEPEWWYSDDGNDKATATRWCQACPVRDACLVATLEEEGKVARSMRWGIRAGLTVKQRNRLLAGKPAGSP